MKNIDSIINKAINESISEITAYHGTDHDFDSFDLNYIGTGSGYQSWGYGVYLSLSPEGVKYYGKKRYTVEIPSDKRKYLIANKIYGKTFCDKLKNKIYRAIINKKTVDWDNWKGCEQELWQELQCIHDIEGASIAGTLEYFVGGEVEAAKFLRSLGYYGLKYTEGDIINVVMFDPSDVTIIKKE